MWDAIDERRPMMCRDERSNNVWCRERADAAVNKIGNTTICHDSDQSSKINMVVNDDELLEQSFRVNHDDSIEWWGVAVSKDYTLQKSMGSSFELNTSLSEGRVVRKRRIICKSVMMFIQIAEENSRHIFGFVVRDITLDDTNSPRRHVNRSGAST